MKKIIAAVFIFPLPLVSIADEQQFAINTYTSIATAWWANARCKFLSDEELKEFRRNLTVVNLAMTSTFDDSRTALAIQESGNKVVEREPYASCGTKAKDLVKYAVKASEGWAKVIRDATYLGAVYGSNAGKFETQPSDFAAEPVLPVTVGKDGVRLKRRLAVTYPPEAAKANLEGSVTIRTRINEYGVVTSAEILTTSGVDSLDVAAIEAAREAIVEPYLGNGKPIRGPVDIPINFTMSRTKTEAVLIEQKSATQINAKAMPQERPNDIITTRKTFSNGAVFSEHKVAGSLEPNIDIGCRSIHNVNSKINPPALIQGAMECIRNNDGIKAWRLFSIGLGFAHYDLKRLADKTTQGAFSSLTINAFAKLSDTERQSASKLFKRYQADSEQVQILCEELTRIGPPSYDPQWAILHGMAAFHQSREDPYLKHVDEKALWSEVLKSRCTPQQIAN